MVDLGLLAQQKLYRGKVTLNRCQHDGRFAASIPPIHVHLAMVEFLLGKEAQINHPGWTPLIYAATSGKNEVIKLLIENHAYIDSTSPNGSTPLMMAVRGGHVTTVKLLVEEDADVLVKNEAGESALSWAERSSNNAEIIKLLRVRLMP